MIIKSWLNSDLSNGTIIDTGMKQIVIDNEGLEVYSPTLLVDDVVCVSTEYRRYNQWGC